MSQKGPCPIVLPQSNCQIPKPGKIMELSIAVRAGLVSAVDVKQEVGFG